MSLKFVVSLTDTIWTYDFWMSRQGRNNIDKKQCPMSISVMITALSDLVLLTGEVSFTGHIP